MVKAVKQSRTDRLRWKGRLKSRNSPTPAAAPRTAARGRRGWSLVVTLACLGAALLAIFIVCLLRHRGSHRQTVRSYTLVDLGPADGDDGQMAGPWPVINQNGDVAGNSEDARQSSLPCVFHAGVKETLPLPGFYDGRVLALNASGAAVGAATREDGTDHPVLWEHGRMSLLAPPGVQGVAHGINDRGSVVWTTGAWPGDHGYARIGGVRISLGDLLPVAINNRDQIACYGFDGHACLWDHGHAKPLTPEGNYLTHCYVPTALSDRGTVVGYISTDPGFWPFECNRNGTALRLPAGAAIRGSDPAISEFPAGVNDRGDMVGGLLRKHTDGYCGFLYSGDVVRDINPMIAPAHGWHVEFAGSINDSGQIAAIATLRGYPHIVRLTPRQNAPWWSLQSLWSHHLPATG